MKPPPHILLAIDPGKSTGWYIFEDGYPTRRYGILRSLDNLVDWLESYFDNSMLPDLVVMENFRLFKHKAMQQSGSHMEVSQAQGMVTAWARRHNIPVVHQDSNILSVAKLWTGVDHNKNHNNSHHWSAYNHGYYWLIKNEMTEIPK